MGGSTSRRILVVDDYPDVLDTTQLLLETRGHVVMTAHDGRSALAVVETFCPEVALVDIDLPDFDGYELARRLRQVPNARHVVLVAITGWCGLTYRIRAYEHGFAAYLLKPFDLDVLLEIVAVAPRLRGAAARA